MIPFYAFIGNLLFNLFYWTNWWDVRKENNYLNILNKGKSVLICCWHGQLLSVIKNLSKINCYALAGTHKDAEIISRICLKWGVNMIRGSSKEKGSGAYKEIVDVLKNPQPSLIFITPDGPAGPARIPKPGIIRAARLTGTAIVPVTAFSTNRWEFSNWDKFYIEKPFGNIFIEYGNPLLFNKNMNYIECRDQLINAMNLLEKINLQYANKTIT
tara:strand:+ start:18030 stop:18671 length:642 start_codon:yes stop_codon:yes gene_type:complete